VSDIFTALLNGLLIAGFAFLLLFGEFIAARIRVARARKEGK